MTEYSLTRECTSSTAGVEDALLLEAAAGLEAATRLRQLAPRLC
jgi:hypothetical protein